MAQLTDGRESVAHFGAAVARLREELSVATHDRPVALIRRQLSQALSSIAETYMTDLCDEPDAETQCERAAVLAMEADSKCADALLVLASLRLVRQRVDEASPLLGKAARLVVDAHARLMQREESESAVPGAGSASAGAGAAVGGGGGGARMDGGSGSGSRRGSRTRASASTGTSGASISSSSDDDDEALGTLAVPDIGARLSLGRSCLEAG